MGLSVAISGGIMIVAFAMVMMMLPSIVENIYSIQQVSTSISEHNDMISKTDISTRRLETEIASPYVNFTLVNQGSNALWKFDSFNLYVEYDGAGPIKRTEELTFDGKCLGGLPSVRKWCIETITNDYKDPDILNLGEGARIRTHLSQNLATTNAVITVVTDNGVVNTSGYDFFDVSTLETLTNVTSTGCGLNQVIRVNSTGYWDCADYPISRISGSTGAAGKEITYQVLTADSADCSIVGLCAAAMTTTGLESGTWKFTYTIIYQSAAAGNGIGFATDATGAVTFYRAHWMHITTGGAAATGIGDDVAATLAGQLVEGKSGATDNAVIGSKTTGVATANTNIMAVLEGIYTTSSNGDLELKISSENGGTAVRVMAGTMLELQKIA